VLADAGNFFPGGDHAEPGIVGRETFEQGFDGRVLELSLHRAGGVLQRLQTIEHQQAAHLAHQPGQPRAAIPGRAEQRIVIAKGREGGDHEGVGRGGALIAGALAVKGPIKDTLGAAPVFQRQFGHPTGHEGGLAHATKGAHDDDVFLTPIPGGIKPGKVFFAPDELLGRLRKFGGGDLDRGLQPGQDFHQIAQHSGAEAFFVAESATIVAHVADAGVMPLLRLLLGGAENKAGVARNHVIGKVEVGRQVDEQRAPVVNGEAGLPLGVAEAGLRMGQQRRERWQLGGEVGVFVQQIGHRRGFGQGAGGFAEQVNNAITGAYVVVDFSQRAAAGDDEVFLHRDVERGPHEIAGQEHAVGEEFAADGREEEFFVVRHGRRSAVGGGSRRLRVVPAVTGQPAGRSRAGPLPDHGVATSKHLAPVGNRAGAAGAGNGSVQDG
jgi:hypothetical protein